ncbi:MAG: LptF/LptG family permease [Kiritimatiellae bacterium]|nr:LptF/LptG family permease [Kiritimatiellia bacterium]
MRILSAYIARGFLMTFGISLLVFMFVMAIANIFKVIDLFSRGVSGILILKVFSYGIPFSLIFAIPMSVLAAVFLQFNRLSSDREIVAMRACGISLWTIVRTPLLIALIFCAICVYINCNVAPDSHYARRKVLSQLGIETPVSLLDEGRFIRDFPGLTIYIGKKHDKLLKDIVIHQIEASGLKRTIRAVSGTITASASEPGKIQVNLFRVRIEQPDEQHPENLALTRYLNAEEYPMTIDAHEIINRDIVWKKRADMTFSEIINALRRSVRFAPDDFLDPGRIIAMFNDSRNDAVAYIQILFSDASLAAMETYDGSSVQKRNAARVLAAEFNRIIGEGCIYSPEHFRRANLNERTLEALRNFKPGDAAEGINRMLLEDVFSGQIVKNASFEIPRGNWPEFRTSLLVEASTRLTLSCSCFAFVLLGASLGIKIHRKESSIGIAVAMALVFIFYFFIIIADSLVNRPEFYPHLIVWIPFVLSLALGAYLIKRSS